MSRAVMKQALDALEYNLRSLVAGVTFDKTTKAIAALQAAIDAPEPEPSAWVVSVGPDLKNTVEITTCKADAEAEYERCIEGGYESIYMIQKLYLHPPAVRKRLTDEQIEEITADNSLDTIHAVARAIEAAHGITAPPIKAQHLPADDTEGGAP